jgi:hypothetical protein
MASEQKDLVPDLKILSGIFPDRKDLDPDNCKVISNNFGTCTFTIRLEDPQIGYPEHLIVRLEKTASFWLPATVALQQLGHTQLPDFVLPTLGMGVTTSEDGCQIGYTVMEYLEGIATLEEVWDHLDDADQSRLVDSVVAAIEKLQRAQIPGRDTETILTATGMTYRDLFPPGSPIGGPYHGPCGNIKILLESILHLQDPTNCSLRGSDPGPGDGIRVVSDFDDIGTVQFTRAELNELKRHVVFCHNDLEPRNILVQRTFATKTATVGQYELVAIIDWERAGFYPFAYEYGYKDTVLGTSNLSFSWYSLFKKRTRHLVPQGECHTKLIKALRIISESKERTMSKNVGVRIKAKWVAREEIELTPNVRKGWVRKDGVENVGPYTKEIGEQYLNEVLKDLGYV